MMIMRKQLRPHAWRHSLTKTWDKQLGEQPQALQHTPRLEKDPGRKDEVSFIQLRRNIDDDNAEAAEMARLEAQSDKDMGEDDPAFLRQPGMQGTHLLR